MNLFHRDKCAKCERLEKEFDRITEVCRYQSEVIGELFLVCHELETKNKRTIPEVEPLPEDIRKDAGL